MIDSADILIALFAGLVGLLILFIILDSRKRLTGRIRRERTTFNTVYPKRK